MDDEKRIIEGYEIKYAVRLGGGEVVLGERKDAQEAYLCADCSWNNPFGVEEYKNAIVSADYMEIAREFTQRLTQRVEAIEAERARRGIPLQTLSVADCEPNSSEKDWEGSVIVIKPEKLVPESRFADYQLAKCTGGNGSRHDAIGRAVFCTNLYTGESSRWERQDIAGIILPERMPEWAKERLAALQKPAVKESVIEKIRQAKQSPTPKKSTNKKHRSGPEL